MRRRFLVVSATALLAVSPTWAKSNFKILHSFAGKPDGGGVFAGLVLDAKGNLYGVTIGGERTEKAQYSSSLPARAENGAKRFCIASARGEVAAPMGRSLRARRSWIRRATF